MIVQLDTENADFNLTTQQTVLTHTPDAVNPMLCQGLIMLGDGTKNLDGTGGDFELSISVGGQTIEPDPQVVTFSTATRTAVWTTIFPVVANQQVLLKVKSPNGADTDVDVTAYLYDVSAQGALVLNNLDHIAKTATAAADMTTEITDNSILSRILANGDTSAFEPSTDGLQLIRDRGDAAWITATGFAVAGNKMDLIDAPNSTAVSVIQSGLGTSAENVANLTAIQGISNVTRLSVALVRYMERPSAGNKAIKIEVALKDSDGNMEDPDSSVLALQVYNSTGTSRNTNLYKEVALSSNLDAGSGTFTGFSELERAGVGLYFFYYKLASDATEEELLFKFGWEENAVALYEYKASQVTDATNDLTAIIAAIAGLNNISPAEVNAEVDTALGDYDGPTKDEMDSAISSAQSTITSAISTSESNVTGAVSSAHSTTDGLLATLQAAVTAIKAITDNHPANLTTTLTSMTALITAIKAITDNHPVNLSTTLTSMTALITAIKTITDNHPADLSAVLDGLDALIDGIKERTDNLPDSPADTADVQITVNAGD